MECSIKLKLLFHFPIRNILVVIQLRNRMSHFSVIIKSIMGSREGRDEKFCGIEKLNEKVTCEK